MNGLYGLIDEVLDIFIRKAVAAHFTDLIFILSACQHWQPDLNSILPWIDGSYTTPRDTTRGRMAGFEKRSKRYPTDLTDEEWLC